MLTWPGRGDGCVRVVGARIVSGRYTSQNPEGWTDFLDMLPLELHSVQNKGKFLYFQLCSGVSIWSTLGMSGGWTLRPHRHARLELDLLRGQTFGERLTFYDSRNFGTFKACFDDENLRKRLTRLGPSWTEPGEVTLDVFRALLRKGGKPQRRRRLAVFLMDQTKTAGIGNYILAEALYAARIHPWARVGDVAQDDAVIAALHSAISEISMGSLEAQRGSAARRAGLHNAASYKGIGCFQSIQVVAAVSRCTCMEKACAHGGTKSYAIGLDRTRERFTGCQSGKSSGARVQGISERALAHSESERERERERERDGDKTRGHSPPSTRIMTAL